MATLLDGLPLGEKFRSAQGRTLSEGDFSLLTNLTWTTSALHSDKEYMKRTPFGERILAGPCVLALVLGLTRWSGLYQAFERCGLRTTALLGYEEVRFTAPVLPGDTLTSESEILDARQTKNPSRAVVKVRDTGYKQTGEKVMEGTRLMLMERAQ